MTLDVAIRHETHYRFDRVVDIMPHIIRLRPAPHCRTEILRYHMQVWPESRRLFWQQDIYGNHVAKAVFPEKSNELLVEVELAARLRAINPFDFLLDIEASRYPFSYPERWLPTLAPYLDVSEDSSLLREWVSQAATEDIGTINLLVDETQRTAAAIGYQRRDEPGLQRCADTLQLGSGSCRDSSWLLTQGLRCLGLAARFVSGYLIQVHHDDAGNPASALTDEDYSELHAWVEVFVPGAGWIGLDPTSGMLAGAGHIPLACTPTPDEAAPVTGNTGRCRAELIYRNTIIDI